MLEYFARTRRSLDRYYSNPSSNQSSQRERAPPPSPRREPVSSGQFVTLKDLVNRGDLNGLSGITQCLLGEGRVRVKTELGTVVSVRAVNL